MSLANSGHVSLSAEQMDLLPSLVSLAMIGAHVIRRKSDLSRTEEFAVIAPFLPLVKDQVTVPAGTAPAPLTPAALKLPDAG